MATQNVMLKAAGLQTYFQSLMEISPGALLKANNTVINREGVIEPRRGIRAYGSSFGISTDRAKQLLQYKGVTIRHFNDVLAFDDGTETYTDFDGSYTEPVTGSRILSAESKSNLYFTTNEGVKKISAATAVDLAIANIIQDSGGAKAITGSVKVNYGTPGFLTANANVSYKILWIYTDRNQNTIFGSPSASMIASNTTTLTPVSVDILFQIPYNVTTTDYKYRIYRSEIATLTPSDELYQIFEGTPTAGELTARSISHTDSVSEALRIGGVPLYTNQYSGEGILQANEPPPSARDIALFKGHMFYGNTRTRHSSTISLIDSSGFTSGTSDFIITDGTTTNTYTFWGTKEKSRIVVNRDHTGGGGNHIIPSSYFKMSSASNERQYAPWFDTTGTDTAPSVPGCILIRINLSTGGIVTTTEVAATMVLAINTNAGNDFIASNITNTVTIENTNNGICSNGILEGVIDINTAGAIPASMVFSTLVQGTGEDLTTSKVLISAKSTTDAKIEETSKSLVNNINSNPNELVTAYYASNVGEVPGKIILQSKTLIDTVFYLGTSDSAITDNFTPELGIAGTLLTQFPSTAEKITNRLYYSKYQEHEAVPLLNYIDIGSRDQPIYRIIALRESLFILKGDGVYRVAGDGGATPTWNASIFDNTSIIKAPDTAVTLSNECYFFSNQGIVKLNETDLSPVSQPIKDKLTPFIATNPNLAAASFAVSYESDRSLLVWTVLNKTDTIATVCYRYNVFTQTWTNWNISKTCAVLNIPQDTLYFGSGVDNYVEKERKNFDRFDYADRQITATIGALGISGNMIKPTQLNSISTGDVLLQEQYVTIYQFNSLLQKLDLDNGLAVHGFYSELQMLRGDDLTSKMASLVIKLNIADPLYVYTFSGSTDFATIQTEFNDIIDILNNSDTTYFNNYNQSVGTLKYESIVTDVNRFTKEVTVNNITPFTVGTILIYKSINTEIEYAPQHVGDPAGHKQFSTGTFMFERRDFYTAQVAYNSDISDNYEEISFIPNSAGTFGSMDWGDGSVWGGQGDQSQIRTYIPLKKQRCRFLGCKFLHNVALESFELYGLSLSVRTYTIPDRDYK